MAKEIYKLEPNLLFLSSVFSAEGMQYGTRLLPAVRQQLHAHVILFHQRQAHPFAPILELIQGGVDGGEVSCLDAAGEFAWTPSTETRGSGRDQESPGCHGVVAPPRLLGAVELAAELAEARHARWPLCPPKLATVRIA